MSGLEGRDAEESEQFFSSDPLGLGIGCIEKCCSSGRASSEGSPEEKRERAEALKVAHGPPMSLAPADWAGAAKLKDTFPQIAAELQNVKFGEALIKSKIDSIAPGFTRPA